MKCSTGHATATAITAVLTVFLAAAQAIAATPAAPDDCRPSAQSLAYFYGAYSSDGSPPNRAYLDPDDWRQSCKPGASSATRQALPARKAAQSHCGWNSSRAACKDGGRVTMSSNGRTGRSQTAARSPNSRLLVRAPLVGSSNLAGAVPIALLSARDAGLGARPPSEPSPGAGFPVARYADQDAIATPPQPSNLRPFPLLFQDSSNEPGTHALGEAGNARPGPYAMLLIGLALAAFMMFRRLGSG